SQTEVNTLEQDLKRSSEVVLDLERRIRLHEDEKAAFEKELQEWRDKYKTQARELKEALNKQKLAMEQYTDIND
ncbi:serine/threonine-protein kinase MRCK alpha, partial [Elysia marginata]